MSPNTAKVVSRTLVGLAVVMVATAVVIGITTYDRQRPGEIVIVPAERADEIVRGAAALDPDQGCAGEVTLDPSLGQAASVYCELRSHRATGSTFEAGWGEVVGSFLVAVVWLGTGTMIMRRQPRNTAGWIFVAIGMVFALEVFSISLLVRGVKVDPGSVPLTDLWAVIAEFAFVPFALISLLFLLFPDGKPPTPRWRWAQRLLLIGLGIAVTSFALDPGPLNNLVDSGIVYLNPIGIPALRGTAGAITAIGMVLAIGASLSTIVAVRGRFRRSTGETRQQMRWLVFVATLAGAVFLIGLVGGLVADVLISNPEESLILGVDPFDALFITFVLTLVAGIPTAYLVAIFKHGLWDLDVVIRKAAVALVLTLLLVAVGLLVIGVLGQSALWEGTDRPLAILMGVIAGVLLWPMIRIARRVARRIVFGRRADPYAVLTEFSGRVAETYATEEILPRMAQILGSGTGAKSACVWLKVGGELRPEATWPAAAPSGGLAPIPGDLPPEVPGAFSVEVRDRGELLGALSVWMPANDPMNPSRERLVRDLASQAGLVLRNVRLIEDLRASRQRLVLAQDDERRRIERNIHDGAQQQLVALSVKTRLARQVANRDPGSAVEILEQIEHELQTALEDLRDLARGIYPPLLADRGLYEAILSQAKRTLLPIDVEEDGIRRYRQDVESAVYFSVLEALQNVAKYAEASSVVVRLSEANGELAFTVDDDGRGFDPNDSRPGTGLRGMADRLETVGGRLEVRSAPGAGTTVAGRLPIRAELVT